MSERVLVTGGAGYLGSRLCAQLLESGHSVVVLDRLFYGGEGLVGLMDHPRFDFFNRDIRDEAYLKELFSRHSFGAVIHLAALVGEEACNVDTQATWEINFEATRALAYHAIRSQVSRFTFLSTCSNYGVSEPGVLAEESSPLNPLSLYAESKVKCEEFLLKEMREQKMTVRVLRLGTLYGLSPKMRFDLLFNELARACSESTPIDIYTPEAWRPYLSIRNACRGIEHVTLSEPPKRQEPTDVYNLVGLNVQKREFLDILAENYPQVEVRRVDRAPDLRDYRVSSSKYYRDYSLNLDSRLDVDFGQMVEALKSSLFVDMNREIYRAKPKKTALDSLC